MKFYHATPRRLKAGDVLTSKPVKKTTCGGAWVFLTTSPVPHYTIWKDAKEKNWHVYEVRPIGKLHKGDWYDLLCERAKIVRRVGSARGLALNAPAKFKEGSYVNFAAHPPGKEFLFVQRKTFSGFWEKRRVG